MLFNGFFRTDSYNPDKPTETWTLVYEQNTPGSYNTTLGWGKYKILTSGGGGGGGASSSDPSLMGANNGQNGQTKEYSLSVFNNQTSQVSGIIGSGGGGGYADGPAHIIYGGTGGTGFQSGVTGNAENIYNFACASGGGGGSTSLNIDNVQTTVAAGGNGGSAICQAGSGWIDGGTGGSGGGTSDNGATGGQPATSWGGIASASSGSNGFIKVYKSNLKPEDI